MFHRPKDVQRQRRGKDPARQSVNRLEKARQGFVLCEAGQVLAEGPEDRGKIGRGGVAQPARHGQHDHPAPKRQMRQPREEDLGPAFGVQRAGGPGEEPGQKAQEDQAKGGDAQRLVKRIGAEDRRDLCLGRGRQAHHGQSAQRGGQDEQRHEPVQQARDGAIPVLTVMTRHAVPLRIGPSWREGGALPSPAPFTLHCAGRALGLCRGKPRAGDTR